MFINPLNGPVTKRSVRSLGSNRIIHNDENNSALLNRNNQKSSTHCYPSKRSDVGGLKQRSVHPKTPSNSKNSRRRALGDISNRKLTNDQKQKNGNFSQTPHKVHDDKVKSFTFNHNNVNAKKNNSTKKKPVKVVTFEGRTEHSSIIPKNLKERRKQRTNASSSKEKKNEQKFRDYNIDDIELPAGRGWIEEQQFFIGSDDLSLASLDCKSTLEDYKAIEEIEVEARRKDCQRYEEKCEKQYQEEMRKFTEMTRFEGLNEDGIGIYIENLENDLIGFHSAERDNGYDCFSDCNDGESISL